MSRTCFEYVVLSDAARKTRYYKLWLRPCRKNVFNLSDMTTLCCRLSYVCRETQIITGCVCFQKRASCIPG